MVYVSALIIIIIIVFKLNDVEINKEIQLL